MNSHFSIWHWENNNMSSSELYHQDIPSSSTDVPIPIFELALLSIHSAGPHCLQSSPWAQCLVWVLLQKYASIKSILIILQWPSRKSHIYCCTAGLSSGSHSSSICKAWLQIAKYSSIFELGHGAGCLPSSGSRWKASVIAGNSFWYSKMFPELEASQVRLTEAWAVSWELEATLILSTQSFPRSNQTLPFAPYPIDNLAGSSTPPSENQVIGVFPTISPTRHLPFFSLLSRLSPMLPFLTADQEVPLEPVTLFSIWPHWYPTSCDEHWRWKDLLVI